MLYQIPRTRPYIHQGSTVQQTHPVPKVTQYEPSLFWAPRLKDPNFLALEGSGEVGPDESFTGPLVQQTHPVPPVTTRNLSYWTPVTSRGAGNLGEEPQFEGSAIYPMRATPQPMWSVRMAQPSLAFPQPNAVAVVVDTIGHQFDQDILPWRYVAARQPAPTVFSHDEASFLFTPAWSLQPAPVIRRWQAGPSAQTDGPTVQSWFIYPQGQPDRARFVALHALRFVVPTTRPLEGPTVHDWFLYALSQPDLRYRQSMVFPLPRWPIEEPGTSIDNDPPPPDPFVPSRDAFQGNQARWMTGSMTQLVGLFVTTDDTYVFPTNQPDLARFALLQALRFVVPAAVDVQQGPTSHQTYVFSLGQPDWPSFVRALTLRAQGPATLPLEGVPPVVDASFVGSPLSWPRLVLPMAQQFTLTGSGLPGTLWIYPCVCPPSTGTSFVQIIND